MPKFLFIKGTFILVLLTLYNSNVRASSIDSTKIELQFTNDPLKQFTLSLDLVEMYFFINLDSAELFANLSLQYASRISNQIIKQQKLGVGYNYLGRVNYYQGDIFSAIKWTEKSQEIFKNINDDERYALGLSNLGILYSDAGLSVKAADSYLESLNYLQKKKDTLNIISTLSNLGTLFKSQNDKLKALEYYEEALRLSRLGGNTIYITNIYNNIGIIYYSEFKNYEKALSYLKESLSLKVNGDNIAKAHTMQNLGNVYDLMNRFDSAYYWQNEALLVRKKLNDQQGLASSYISIAELFYDRDKSKSLANAQLAMKIASDNKLIIHQQEAHFLLSRLYEDSGNFNLSLNHYKQYIILRDSIYNIDNAKAITEYELKSKFREQNNIDSLEHAKENELKDAQIAKSNAINFQQEAELKNRRLIQYVLLFGLVVLAIFFYIVNNRFKVTRKQKIIIEEKSNEVEIQRSLLETKNTEIVDSINYAKRIQLSLLVNDEYLNKYLPKHGKFFAPKDIVSGDFYWSTKRNNKFYLAICDSTGHGVPGAFMSLLNISFLNEAINERHIADANEILNYVRNKLIKAVSSDGAKDGMDGVLLVFDLESKRISYASAFCKPVLIRGKEIMELATDKMPIGESDNMISFRNFDIDYRAGDFLFVYSDGFADQFGGEKGKKFKYKNLNQLLLQLTNNFNDFESGLKLAFTNWKGELEQVDDVCVFGFQMS